MAKAPSPIEALASLLIEAHASGTPIADISPSVTITTAEDAYAVQAIVAPSVGTVVGWKVGRRSDRPATRAPLYRSLLYQSGARIPSAGFRAWIVESELMVRFARDLPAHAEPYTRSEILAAIGGIMPAFEIVESRYAAYPNVDPLMQLADGLSHGAMVVGPEIPLPADADFTEAHIVFRIDGIVQIDRRGGNPAGDILDLLVVTANSGVTLKAGDYVTTGSYTGMPVLPAGAMAEADFPGIGSVTVTRL